MKTSAKLAFLALSIFLSASATGDCRSSRTVTNAPGGKLFKGKVSYQLLKGEQLINDRKYDEARAIFEHQLKRNPNNIDALSGLGMALTMQYKLDAAEDKFDKALAVDQNDPLAHTGKALVTLHRLQSSSKSIIDKKTELLAKAQNEATIALAADPQSQYAHYALGQVYKEQGQMATAYSEFQAAVNADPQYSQAYTGLGLIDLNEGRLPSAAENFQKSIELNTGNSTAHFGLGEVYLRQGQTDAAIKELNTSLYQFTNSAPVHLALGKAYEAQGNIDAALRSYEKAALIKPELKEAYSRQADLHVALGQKYQGEGNVVGAIKELKQAILIDPYNPKPYLALADMRETRGDLELSIADLRSGLELDPNQVLLRQRVANSLLKLEKLDDAIKEYRTALSAQPSNTQCVEGLTRALYLKAQKNAQGAFLSSNEFESALDTIQTAISMKPNDLQLRLAAAKIRSLAGEKVDLSAVGKPTNTAEKIAYAEALLAQNKFEESAKEMKEVIQSTQDVEQILALGDLAVMIKDSDSAEVAYLKASNDPAQARRAKRGLQAVAELRDKATHQETLGSDLARKKMLPSAADTFRAAIKDNPRLPEARLGLAETEQRLAGKSPDMLRDSATQYKAYVSLKSDLPAKQAKKLIKKAGKLEAKAAKIEGKPKQTVATKKSMMSRLVTFRKP